MATVTLVEIDLEEVIIPQGSTVTLIPEGLNGWPAVIYDGEEYDVAIEDDELPLYFE